MSDIVWGILAIVLGIVGLVVVIAGPIVAVVAWQNSRRRKFTRELAKEFGLEACLDEKSRLSKATVRAKGVVDGVHVVVSANTPGTRFYEGPMNSMRVERGEIAVRGAKGPEARLLGDSGAPRDTANRHAVIRHRLRCLLEIGRSASPS